MRCPPTTRPVYHLGPGRPLRPSRGFHRRLPPAIRRTSWSGPASRDSGVHEVGATPGSDDKAHRRGRDRRLLTRMGVERLDLLQFHWWDYKNDGYLTRSNISPTSSRKARSVILRSPISTPSASAPSPTTGSRRLKPGAVLARRPPPRGSDGQILL
jgi:Predicted oxidoreductases (related to aryl-alcohol dehydrogenases)